MLVTDLEKIRVSIFHIIKHEGLSRLLVNAVQHLDPKRIVLFGSRARGTGRATSDFDLAFFLPHHTQNKWSKFVVDAQESPEVLLSVDWVNASDASEKLLERISNEGVTLYEKGKL